MIAVLFLIAAIWLGFVLDEEFEVGGGDFLMRLAAAIVLGAFFAGWTTYGFALVFGFSPGTVVTVMGCILLVNLIAWRRRHRDWAWFRSLLTIDRSFWTASGAIVAIIVFSFAFGAWINRDGSVSFRGNFTDLAYHMGTVAAFVEQSHFPPFNPQSANAKLSYHFMADFVGSILAQGGFSFFYSLKVLMVLLAFSLGTITCRFFHFLLRERAAMVSAAVLFFFGHIGVFHLAFGLLGFPVGNVPLTLGSWRSIEDHLTYPYFNFLNVLVSFFQPQVPFLFGFPLALMVLSGLIRRYGSDAPVDRGTGFLVIIVALLPLFHVHSFLVLAPLLALLVGLPWWRRARSSKALQCCGTDGAPPPKLALAAPSNCIASRTPRFRRQTVALAFAVAATLLFAGIVVAWQFAFILSQPKSPGFSGFDVGEHLGNLQEIPNFLHTGRLWFWVRTGGMPFVLGLIAFALPANFRRRNNACGQQTHQALLILFGVTFAYFLIINLYRFTPNWGDNNKFFLYWNLSLCLFAGHFLSRLWQGPLWRRMTVILLLLVGGVLPSGVEIGSRFLRGPSPLFSAGARVTAEWIRLNTPKDAIFLTSNSYTHYLPALAGRRVVNGSYTRETGFSDQKLEETVARVYRTGDFSLLQNTEVNYVMVGPEERQAYWVNNSILARSQRLVFEQTSNGEKYSIYAVTMFPSNELARLRLEESSREFIELSHLEPKLVTQFGTLRFDENFDQGMLRLKGATYGTGLGTHAPSEIIYDLNGDYSAFEAVVGLDASQGGGVGSVVFHVEVDGKAVFASVPLTAGSIPVPIRIDLVNAQTLTLRVDDAGDGNHCDHADWADAKLIRKKRGTIATPP